MLCLKFFIFVTVMAGASYAMSIECYALRETECQEYDWNKEMPKVVEDLQNICNNLIPLGHCIEGVLEKCAADENLIYDTEQDVEVFRRTLEFVKAACDEDSRVFKALADNLPCVTSSLDTMNDFCTWGGLNETTREKLYNMFEEETRRPCVVDAWMYHCLTAMFYVECGSDVKYAVSEILDNTDYIDPRCREIQNEFFYFKDAFITEFRRGKYGNAAVPGIMEEIAKNLD